MANLPHGGATPESVGVATTLATRTVSMCVRSCPLLSVEARSPRAFTRARASRSALSAMAYVDVLFRGPTGAIRLGNRCSIRLSYGAQRHKLAGVRGSRKDEQRLGRPLLSPYFPQEMHITGYVVAAATQATARERHSLLGSARARAIAKKRTACPCALPVRV